MQRKRQKLQRRHEETDRKRDERYKESMNLQREGDKRC